MCVCDNSLLKFENRSIIDKDMDKSKVPRFLTHPVQTHRQRNTQTASPATIRQISCSCYSAIINLKQTVSSQSLFHSCHEWSQWTIIRPTIDCKVHVPNMI